MSAPAFIHVSGLHKHYRDGKGNDLHILRGVDLDIPQGETVSIMGASGAGKSTLLHIMGGLDHPDSGRISIDGTELSSMEEESRARFRNGTVGFVFQFHHLLMDFTALENVMMPMWIKAGRTLNFRDQAGALLDAVGLGERMTHRPSQLSGGEQQRLAIARAIANSPRVLLADEPTGNLDEETGEKVSELLLRLNREFSLTLVLVTHNPQFAARMLKQFVLEHGVLVPISTNGGHA
ncbi:MAG: ABC transporter ATP-binding protein [Deltaproteobacteria bacterium]|nr:ABC transporter ATP-binding protein [Deltaproteobacteria bacterium]